MDAAHPVARPSAAKFQPLALQSPIGHLGVPLLAIALFLAPYTTWRFHREYLFTISDGLFCLAALVLVAGRRVNMRPFADLTPIWLGGVAAMLIGLLIGSILNGDPGRWSIVATQYGFCYVMLPLLLVRSRDSETVPLTVALLAGVLAMELFGAIVYYGLGGAQEQATWLGRDFITGAHRLGAFMDDANWNAAVIALAAPFLLYLERIGRIGVITTFVGAAILTIGLLLSGSFTGFATTALTTIVFLVVAGGGKSLRLVLGMVALASVTLASGFALPAVFERRVAGAIEQGDLSHAGTFVGRMELIEEAWTIVDRTTLIGLGADQYRVVSRERAPVHNMFLLIWAEGGLMALFGWLALILVPLVLSVRALSRDRPKAALGLAVTLSFLIFSIAAPHMYARIWVVPLLLASSFLCARRNSPRGRYPAPMDYPVRRATTSNDRPASAAKKPILSA